MKKKIELDTGGFSGEAVISYRSDNTIYNHLDKNKFDVYKIDVNPNGWFYEDASGNKTEVNKNDFTITCDGKKIKEENKNDFTITNKKKKKKKETENKNKQGTPGEDGKLQGYFDMMGLPY